MKKLICRALLVISCQALAETVVFDPMEVNKENEKRRMLEEKQTKANVPVHVVEPNNANAATANAGKRGWFNRKRQPVVVNEVSAR